MNKSITPYRAVMNRIEAEDLTTFKSRAEFARWVNRVFKVGYKNAQFILTALLALVDSTEAPRDPELPASNWKTEER